FVLALLGGRERLALQLVGDVLLLQAAQLLVVVGDLVEGLDHLRLQLGLDGRERHLVFELVVIHVAVGGGFRRGFAFGGRGGCRTERSRGRRCRRGRNMGRCRLGGRAVTGGGCPRLAGGGGGGGRAP